MIRSTSNAGAACLTAWLALTGSVQAEASADTDDVRGRETANVSLGTDAKASVDNGSTELPPDESRANKPAENGVYLEGLGAGLLYSINYERIVLDALAIRAGFSYWSVSASASSGSASASASASFINVPITVSYVGLRGLEVGAGTTLMYASGSGSTIGASASGSGISPLGTAMVGYRLHPRGHAGFQFRVGAMAMMGKGLSLSTSNPESFGVLPWLYLSAGAGF